MAISGCKIPTLPFYHADQPDQPNRRFSSTLAFKQALDSSTISLQNAHNALIDDLLNTTPSASGSEQIGSAPITGVEGSTVYEQIASLETQIKSMGETIIANSIPPGSITNEMLAVEVIEKINNVEQESYFTHSYWWQ